MATSTTTGGRGAVDTVVVDPGVVVVVGADVRTVVTTGRVVDVAGGRVVVSFDGAVVAAVVLVVPSPAGGTLVVGSAGIASPLPGSEAITWTAGRGPEPAQPARTAVSATATIHIRFTPSPSEHLAWK
jgi:hypothetical protein